MWCFGFLPRQFDQISSHAIYRMNDYLNEPGKNPSSTDPQPAGPSPRLPAESDTAYKARMHHERHAKATRAPIVRSGGALFKRYKPTGVKVSYAENKVGILPDIETVLQNIANEAEIDLQDEAQLSGFLEAIVVDVYVNPYSDKRDFSGEIEAGGVVVKRQHIRNVLEPLVGTAYRRFARAMAPIVVEVLSADVESFRNILSRRALDLNLSTPYEAIRHFDGSDALVYMDRDAARRAAEAKRIALTYRKTGSEYNLDNSSKSVDVNYGRDNDSV